MDQLAGHEFEPRIDADFPRIDLGDRGDPLLHRDVTGKILGAAFEVHKELGPGFLEKVYETALLHELRLNRTSVEPQAVIPVVYKRAQVGLYYADLLVEGKVICEIKAIESLAAVHSTQLLHYLKATGIEVGLLLNFGTSSLQHKRLVKSK